MARFLSIDYGTKNVGIAVSDETATMAFPRVVLQNDIYLVGEIKKMIEDEEIEGVVIGESLDYNGEPNPLMEDINYFKAELEKNISTPIYFEPEFLTSHQAAKLQGGANSMLDASAAAIILQSFLDKQ